MSEIEWTTVFNENYNDDNSQCDPLHVFYRNSSHVLDQSVFDPQLRGCMLGNQFNWGVHWITDPSQCDIHQPSSGPPSTFPSSPVVGA